MNTLIFLGFAALVVGGTYAADRLLSAYFLRKASRKPDNKDLFQK